MAEYSLHIIQEDDIKFIHQGLSDLKVTEHYGVHFGTIDETKTQMEWYQNLLDTGTGIWWKILDENNNFCGAIGLNGKEGTTAEIGYWIIPEKWGNRIISKVFDQVKEHAFGEFGLSGFYADIIPQNIPSLKLAQGLGLKFEKQLIDKDGDLVDRYWLLSNT